MSSEKTEEMKKSIPIYAVLTKPDGFSTIYDVIKDIETGNKQ